MTHPVFALFNLIFLPLVYFLYPETANRTLEDLDDYFDMDSNHNTIIPVGDRIAKQRERPAEAYEAERKRILLSADNAIKAKMGKDGGEATHIEVVEQ